MPVSSVSHENGNPPCLCVHVSARWVFPPPPRSSLQGVCCCRVCCGTYYGHKGAKRNQFSLTKKKHTLPSLPLPHFALLLCTCAAVTHFPDIGKCYCLITWVGTAFSSKKKPFSTFFLDIFSPPSSSSPLGTYPMNPDRLSSFHPPPDGTFKLTSATNLRGNNGTLTWYST